MITRAANRWRRFATEHFARREFRLPGDVPYVSFTFDDFPRTALTEGGRILTDRRIRGTYFVSFNLLETNSVSGPVASLRDLHSLLDDGHELGCHTFDHADGSVVSAIQFKRSIDANQSALINSGLTVRFETFAYPLNGPAWLTKKVAGSCFTGCRGGGQTFNEQVADLSLLKAYFLDRRSHDRMDEIRDLIERNAAARGWLIFATHDVGSQPSVYGCAADRFASIVDMSVRSGAQVLPMRDVYGRLGITCAGQATNRAPLRRAV
jgi:peptidoglycan/xylan/chitin deacetylase (PgdA/CDA1 family)